MIRSRRVERAIFANVIAVFVLQLSVLLPNNDFFIPTTLLLLVCTALALPRASSRNYCAPVASFAASIASRASSRAKSAPHAHCHNTHGQPRAQTSSHDGSKAVKNGPSASISIGSSHDGRAGAGLL